MKRKNDLGECLQSQAGQTAYHTRHSLHNSLPWGGNCTVSFLWKDLQKHGIVRHQAYKQLPQQLGELSLEIMLLV